MFALPLFACASVLEAPESADLEAKKFEAPKYESGIYLYRPGAVLDSIGVTAKIALDGEVVGELSDGTYFLFHTKPGQHTFQVYDVHNKSRINDTLKMTAQPGTLHFIEVDTFLCYTCDPVGGFRFEIIESESAGRAGVEAASLAYHSAEPLEDGFGDADEGVTALHTAAQFGGTTVRMLLEHGTSTKFDAQTLRGRTPLMYAAAEGDPASAELLIGEGASVSMEDNEGLRALHYAAFNGHIEVVRFLIKRGADINAVAPEFGSPLTAAASGGQVEVMRELVRRGASTYLLNGDASTEDLVANALIHRVVADELVLNGQRDDAVLELSSSSTDLDLAARQYLDLSDEHTKLAASARSKAGARFLGEAVLHAMALVGPSYMARTQNRQFAEAMALRKAKSPSQYFAYNTKYQNALRTKPYPVYPAPSSGVSPRSGNNPESVLAVQYDILAKANRKQAQLVQSLKLEIESIVECLHAVTEGGVSSCYSPVTISEN